MLLFFFFLSLRAKRKEMYYEADNEILDPEILAYTIEAEMRQVTRA